MMLFRVSTVALALTAFFAVDVAACSAPAEVSQNELPTGPPAPPARPLLGKDASPGLIEGGALPAPPSPVPAPQCAAKGPEQCGTCCDAAFPSGFAVYEKARDTCFCAAQSACQAACSASLCAGSEPDEACQDCLFSVAADACYEAAATACNADAACKGMGSCIEQCPAISEDGEDGGQGGGN